MTDEQLLQTIKDLANNATPGPWFNNKWHVATSPDVVGGYPADSKSICETNDGEYIENGNGLNDAAFIAKSRQLVPELIAEIEYLRETIATERKENLLNSFNLIGRGDKDLLKGKIEEMGNKFGELNVFLQERTTDGWGEHVVDVAIGHIEKTEQENKRLRKIIIDAGCAMAEGENGDAYKYLYNGIGEGDHNYFERINAEDEKKFSEAIKNRLKGESND